MKTMKMIRNVALVISCLGLVLAGCGGMENDTTTEFGWQVGGCAGQEHALVEESEGYAEECGPEPLLPDEIDYCTETLFWEYDTDTQTLHLVDGPVSLNCCGVRYVDHGIAEGFYTLVEMDEPGEGDFSRCRCMCDSIYSVCIHGVPAGLAPVRLYRHVTDDGTAEPTLIWEGELDLSAGSGQVDLGPSGSWNCIQ